MKAESLNNIISAILLLTAVVMSSCLSGDDDNDYTYYEETALTQFSLGTMKTYSTTKTSDGRDSTVITTFQGSTYKFQIDQTNHTVYNIDSLPSNTDVKHVLASITSKNSGVILIKSMTSDSLFYFSSSDSIDFSSPRVFRIVSQSGANYRDYTITLNVHNQDGDVMKWDMLESQQAFAAMKDMKAIALGDYVYVFGSDGMSTIAYKTSINDGHSWTVCGSNLNMLFDAEACQNVIAKDNYIYLLNNHFLLRATDGRTWELIDNNTAIKKLVGATTLELYGMNADGLLMVSRDNGISWTVDEIDDDPDLLPQDNISYVCHKLNTNNNIERIMLFGNGQFTSYAHLWTKLVDVYGKSNSFQWSFVDVADINTYAAPKLLEPVVIGYGDYDLLLGAELNGSFEQIRESNDGGIVWKKSSNFVYPTDFDGNSETFTAAVDSNNFIWIICGGSGKVWRGRQNRMGWSYPQQLFTE